MARRIFIAWCWLKHFIDAVWQCGASNHTHSIIFGRQSQLCNLPSSMKQFGQKTGIDSCRRPLQAGIQQRRLYMHYIVHRMMRC